MSRLKVGLIGCGQVAQSVYLKILNRLPNVELIALAETDPRRREEASRLASRAIAFDNYQDLLVMPNIDAVFICLPSSLHADAAVAALQHRKHVYLEKPLATNLDEGRRILAAWKQAGVVGMTGFNYRRNRLFQAARAYIQSGKLEKLITVRTVFSTVAKPLSGWKQTRQSGGGVLLTLASHHVDLVLYLFGKEVRLVSATVQSQNSEDDTAILELQLDDGLLVQSFFSLSAVEEDCFEIYGSAGKLTVDRYQSLDIEITEPTISKLARLKRLSQRVRSLVHSPYILEKLRSPGHEPSYQKILTDFVAAALGNQPTTPNFWDGYRSLAVIVAAEESARTGRVVPLASIANLSLAF